MVKSNTSCDLGIPKKPAASARNDHCRSAALGQHGVNVAHCKECNGTSVLWSLVASSAERQKEGCISNSFFRRWLTFVGRPHRIEFY